MVEFVFDLDEHKKWVLEQLKLHGFSRLSGYNFFLAVSERYFSELPVAIREDIRGSLYDCCESIVDSVLAARMIGRDLGNILTELDDVARVRHPKRGPLPSRLISPATLELIAGHWPERIRPHFADESLHSEFGAILGSNAMGIPGEPEKQQMVAARITQSSKPQNVPATFVTSPRSEILGSLLHLHDANDAVVSFGGLPAHWAPVLRALGFNSVRDIERGVSIREILTLPSNHRAEIRALAEGARKRIQLAFGIRYKRDSLRINPGAAYFRPPMARLLACLCEIIAPFPEVAEVARYELIYTASERGNLRDLYSTLLQYIERRVACAFEKRAGQQTNEKISGKAREFRHAAEVAMRAAGLSKPSKEVGDESVRFIQRFVTCHRQIAILHLIGTQIAEALNGISFESDTTVAVPNSNGCEVNWTDYHNIGRWRATLRVRLGLGLVDSGRRQKLRYGLPEQAHWRWPREASPTQPLGRLVLTLVSAARSAAKELRTEGKGLDRTIYKSPLRFGKIGVGQGRSKQSPGHSRKRRQ